MVKFDKLKKTLFYTIAATEVLFVAYLFVFAYHCQDHVEHLHAAWLVWQGEVPYRDFFEHHNPLLWFILAPITALFYLNPYIIYVSRIINALIYGVMFYGFYALSRDFLRIRKTAFCLMLMLFFIDKKQALSFMELSPDGFMNAAFVWGFYYYCRFLREKAQKALNISFILFCSAFFFLQKISLIFIVLGTHVLFLLYKKELKFSVLFKACLYPAILCTCFLGYLYYTDAFPIYFTFNYDLNTAMTKFMGDARISSDFFVAYFYPLMGVVFLHHFLKSGNRYRNLLAGIIFGEYIIKMNIWAPWIQYFILTNVVCLLIVAQSIIDFIKYKRGKLLLTAVVLAQAWSFYQTKLQLTYVPYFKLHKFVMNNTDKNDVLINGQILFYNIYGKNPGYYWFGYQNIAPIAYYLYGYDEKPIINQMLYKYKPKFFYNVPYYNLLVANNNQPKYKEHLKKIYPEINNHREGADFFSQQWSNLLTYDVDKNFLNAYYTTTPFYRLLIRKDLPYQEIE